MSDTVIDNNGDITHTWISDTASPNPPAASPWRPIAELEEEYPNETEIIFRRHIKEGEHWSLGGSWVSMYLSEEGGYLGIEDASDDHVGKAEILSMPLPPTHFAVINKLKGGE